jgi:hypothetical protein
MADLSDADLCRRNGWTAGTRLVGDQGFGPTVIEITAVGKRRVMAKAVSGPGSSFSWEQAWSLSDRDWAWHGRVKHD